MAKSEWLNDDQVAGHHGTPAPRKSRQDRCVSVNLPAGYSLENPCFKLTNNDVPGQLTFELTFDLHIQTDDEREIAERMEADRRAARKAICDQIDRAQAELEKADRVTRELRLRLHQFDQANPPL